MALVTSYSSLLTELASYLARSDLTSDIPGFVQGWEDRFYREPDNWGSWMEQSFNVTITNNVAAVPTDYIGTKVAYISGQISMPLKRISLEQLYSRYPRAGGTGTPVYIARNGANFEFGPIAGSGTLKGTYYGKPTAIRSYITGGADAVAHFLILNATDLLRYGCLLEAEPFLKNDTRLQTWGNLYKVALDAYRGRMREEEYDSPMTVVG